jgi:hypothetical protein
MRKGDIYQAFELCDRYHHHHHHHHHRLSREGKGKEEREGIESLMFNSLTHAP